ncbi:MAG: DUF6488 family protein [Pseudoalteromonas sp.]|uniref:DUF6488 family protein n=1 Tax=Pseudoalteromonas sp. TaxID=53249 RepID=UPI0025CCC812|nr:DUF6488 family protein [Pseudoalteromonas sp.]MCH2085571.1 DUF6488 family protein [Pseudoalteromonas sp.]
MKILTKLAFMSSMVFASSTMAHSDGHGKVDKSKILQAAQTSAKTLTFKDKGMSVGKLDSSWNKVSKENFKIIEETGEGVLVRATNENNHQTIFFMVSRGGKVMEVKDEQAFNHDHGHSH